MCCRDPIPRRLGLRETPENTRSHAHAPGFADGVTQTIGSVMDRQTDRRRVFVAITGFRVVRLDFCGCRRRYWQAVGVHVSQQCCNVTRLSPEWTGFHASRALLFLHASVFSVFVLRRLAYIEE